MSGFKYVFAVVFALVVVSGCGGGEAPDQPDLFSVTGKVTQGGQPLSKMTVTFTPVGGGRPASGTTDESGSYTLEYKAGLYGAPAGMHAVRLQFVDVVSEDYASSSDSKAKKGQEESDLKGLPKSAFDGTLQKEVKTESNEINIEF